jgi:hypothetical protein
MCQLQETVRTYTGRINKVEAPITEVVVRAVGADDWTIKINFLDYTASRCASIH